ARVLEAGGARRGRAAGGDRLPGALPGDRGHPVRLTAGDRHPDRPRGGRGAGPPPDPPSPGGERAAPRGGAAVRERDAAGLGPALRRRGRDPGVGQRPRLLRRHAGARAGPGQHPLAARPPVRRRPSPRDPRGRRSPGEPDASLPARWRGRGAMKPLTALLVDDEPLALLRLRTLLRAERDVRVVGECEEGRAAVEAIRRLRPDLVFLDVQMPEKDGFEVLRELPPGERPVVIFATAFDSYAVRAFDAHAFDYLLKPI